MTLPVLAPATNDRYLEAALRWLRLLLEQRAAPAGRLPVRAPRWRARPAAPPAPARPRGCLFFWAPPAPEAVPVEDELAPPEEPSRPPPSAAEVDAARADMDRALAADPPPPMADLQRAFGLDPAERDTLLLAAAPDLDPAFAPLIAAAQRGWAGARPTFRLAVDLFGYWNVATPTAALRWYRLVEVHQPGDQLVTAAAVRADERVVNFLNGVNSLDDQVRTYLSPLPTEVSGLQGSQQAAVGRLVAALPAAGGSGGVVQLLGADLASKEMVAGRVAHQLGRHLYRLPAEVLPTGAAALDDLARLWDRESRLLPLALYLDAREVDAHTPAAGAVGRFVERAAGGPVLVSTREPMALPVPAGASVDVGRPTTDEQRGVWRQLVRAYYAASGPGAGLGPPPAAEVETQAGRLAAQFSLNTPAMVQAYRAGAAGPVVSPAALGDRLWAACKDAVRPGLDALAQRLDPTAATRPVLADPEGGLLDQILTHVRQRGRVLDDWHFRARLTRGQGLSILFAGESGTGKTMAAEWLARELNLALYRVDPAQAFDKYIGETPKNFRRLFDAAEDGGAILFFDEADTYFGKRSEVRDSHDRYANLEVNYLLQRMETFRGLAILATNARRAVDSAFLRRLNFVVNFPFPRPAERTAIWRQSFPPTDPRAGYVLHLSDADYELLATFRLTGGSIRTAALSAAFAAAAEQADGRGAGRVELRHAVAAAVLECQKFAVEVPAEIRAWQAKEPSAPSAAPAIGRPPAVRIPAGLPAPALGGGS